MPVVKKNIGTAEVEMGTGREFGDFLMCEELGKVGPFKMYRGLSGVDYEIRDDNGMQIRISVKALLIEAAHELAAEIERRKAEGA